MRQAPKLEDDKLNATVSSKLYDINNEIFEDLGAEKRELIQPNDVPQLLKMPLFLSKTVVSINTLVWIRFGLSVLPFQMSKMVDYKAEVP